MMKVKVLFIAGWGRSGTTLLDMLLGQLPGFFSGGELRYVWDRGFLENRPCGCSQPFRSCPVWSRVASRLELAVEGKAEKLVASRDAFRSWHCWTSLTSRGRTRLAKKFSEYADALTGLYYTLADVTGARVIIDSSKFPSHGYMLALLPNIELYVVHVVRDPRAVAFSWQRKKIYDVADGQPNYIKPHRALRSSFYWWTWNLTSHFLWSRGGKDRYRLITYEEFMRNPRDVIVSLSRMAGAGLEPAFFEDLSTVWLEGNHMASGNPARFKTGRITLVPDEQWRSDMPPFEKTWLTAVNLPLLYLYGYLRRRDTSGGM